MVMYFPCYTQIVKLSGYGYGWDACAQNVLKRNRRRGAGFYDKFIFIPLSSYLFQVLPIQGMILPRISVGKCFPVQGENVIVVSGCQLLDNKQSVPKLNFDPRRIAQRGCYLQMNVLRTNPTMVNLMRDCHVRLTRAE